MNLETGTTIEAATDRVMAISRIGLSGEASRSALHVPFEPIASILARCEEKAGALMRPKAA